MVEDEFVIGDYELEEPIGEDAWGDMFTAKEISSGKRVVVRVLPDKAMRDEAKAAAFIRWINKVKTVEHPALQRVLNGGLSHGRYYCALEETPGITLQQLFEEGKKLTEEAAIRYIKELAGALYALHTKGLVHGRVKPENIVLTAEGKAVLLTSGVPYPFADEATNDEYTAPETQKSGKTSPRSDLYSLGVCFFMMLTGKRPAEVKTKKKGMIPPVSKFRPSVSEDLSEVVAVLMERDPKERYPTAKVLLRDLKALEAGRTPPFALGDESLEELSATGRAKKRTAIPSNIIIAGIVILAGIVTAVVVLTGSKGSRLTITSPDDPSQLYVEAEKFMRENPDDFKNAIAMFEKVRKVGAGTAYEMKAAAAIERLEVERKDKARKKLLELRARAVKMIEDGAFDAAVAVLHEMPEDWQKAVEEDMKTAVEDIRSKIRVKINEMYESAVQALKEGKPRKASRIMAKLKRTPYKDGADLITQLEEKFKEESKAMKEEIEQKRLAEARIAMEKMFAEFDPPLLAGKYEQAEAVAKTYMEKAKQPTARGLAMMAAGLADAMKVQSDSLQRELMKQLGKTVTITTPIGERTGVIRRLTPAEIELEVRTGNGQSKREKYKLDDLTEEDRKMLIPQFIMQNAYDYLIEAISALQRKQATVAEELLKRAKQAKDAKPLTALIDHYLVKTGGMVVGSKEAAAEDFWKERLAPYLAREEVRGTDAVMLRNLIDRFKKRFAGTDFFEKVSDELLSLQEKIATPTRPSKGRTVHFAGIWKKITANAPSVRSGAGAAMDTVHGRCILYGGNDKSLNDLWSFDPVTLQWTCLLEAGPGANRPAGSLIIGHSAPFTFHARKQKCILFSGRLGSPAFLFWAYDPAEKTWENAFEIMEEKDRIDFFAIGYSAATGKLIGLPSVSGEVSPYEIDIDKKTIERWTGTVLNEGGVILPSWITAGSFCSDPSGRFLIYGGSKGDAYISRTVLLDSANKRLLKVKPKQAPPPLGAPSLCYASKEGVWVMFGGETDDESHGRETWTYDPINETWNKVKTESAPPMVPWDRRAIWYDEKSDRVILVAAPEGAERFQTWTLQLVPR